MTTAVAPVAVSFVVSLLLWLCAPVAVPAHVFLFLLLLLLLLFVVPLILLHPFSLLVPVSLPFLFLFLYLLLFLFFQYVFGDQLGKMWTTWRPSEGSGDVSSFCGRSWW